MGHPELQPTGGWRWAEAVDWLVFVVVCVALVVLGVALGWPAWSLWLLVIVGAPLLATLNEVLSVAWWGQTLGKRLAGLRVVRADTLEVPGLRRAAVRAVLVGPLVWAPWHTQLFAGRRALFAQDRLAGTVIVDDAAWRAALPAPAPEAEAGPQDGDGGLPAR
jgi:uncharacterized RDD family membrane protein YckC